MSWTNVLHTALTTVSQPAYDLGHESARLLLSRLHGYSGSPRTVVLPTSLNIRASSLPKQTYGAGRPHAVVRGAASTAVSSPPGGSGRHISNTVATGEDLLLSRSPRG